MQRDRLKFYRKMYQLSELPETLGICTFSKLTSSYAGWQFGGKLVSCDYEKAAMEILANTLQDDIWKDALLWTKHIIRMQIISTGLVPYFISMLITKAPAEERGNFPWKPKKCCRKMVLFLWAEKTTKVKEDRIKTG